MQKIPHRQNTAKSPHRPIAQHLTPIHPKNPKVPKPPKALRALKALKPPKTPKLASKPATKPPRTIALSLALPEALLSPCQAR